MDNKTYVAPAIEIYEVIVEQGFAGTGSGGNTDAWRPPGIGEEEFD